MILTLNRDQAEAVRQIFFPYMKMLCETKIRDASNTPGADFEEMTYKVYFYTYLEIVKKFTDKINAAKKILYIKLTDSQAVVLYVLLYQCEVQQSKEYYYNLKYAILYDLEEQVVQPG